MLHSNMGKAKVISLAFPMQRHSFDFFTEQLSVLYPSLPDDKSRIEGAFGKTLFVYLRRENKLYQAISYVKAEQPGLWHIAANGTELERLSEPTDPFAAISAQLELSKQMETEWETWFERENIEPLRITHSELPAAPYATLLRVLKTPGLEYKPRAEITPLTTSWLMRPVRNGLKGFNQNHNLELF